MKTLKEKILLPVFVAFIISLFPLCYGLIQSYYKQPRIVVNTTGYYSYINNNQVGHIEVTNWGASEDKDITINVLSQLNKGDIKTDGASTDNTVDLGKNESKFVIGKLNPRDTAIISFSSLNNEPTFDYAYNSKSNNIEEPITAPDLLEFTTFQKFLILTIILGAFALGIFIGKPSANFKK